MNTPDGSRPTPTAPAPPSQSTTPFDPDLVGAMANAMFGEAFAPPARGATPAQGLSAPPVAASGGMPGPSSAPGAGAFPAPAPPFAAPPSAPAMPSAAAPFAAPPGSNPIAVMPPPSPAAGPSRPAAAPEGSDRSSFYWMPAEGPPGRCATGGDLSTAFASSAVQGIPRLDAPAEAEASRATEGRGLGFPLPMTPSSIGDLLLAGAFPSPPPTAVPPGASAAPSYFGSGASAAPYFLQGTASPTAPAAPAASSGAFDVHAVRKDFPALQQTVHGRPLVWLDNAATTQKPRQVIDAIVRFYERDNSNIHRAAHELARRATDAYENARDIVRRFLGAGSAEEIVFARGTTEAINLVAQTWGRQSVRAGDEILLTTLEHHANIVPWQMLARETGAVLKVVPITDRGEVVLEEYARLLGPKTRLAGFPQVSNALGTILPVREMAAMAHRHGARVLVDGAQSVPHLRAGVQDVDADFFVFSGHKVYGPTGIGALYAKKELLGTMPPWQGGGSMIRTVTFEQTTYSDPPAKFEAGTPNIGDAVGLGAAIEYVERIGIDQIAAHEQALLEYATERMKEVPGLRMIGTAPEKASVLSFVLEGARVEDVGRHLDAEGIAVRAGHHCAMPTMQRYGLTGTVRPSLGLYNTKEDVDALVTALHRYRHV